VKLRSAVLARCNSEARTTRACRNGGVQWNCVKAPQSLSKCKLLRYDSPDRLKTPVTDHNALVSLSALRGLGMRLMSPSPSSTPPMCAALRLTENKPPFKTNSLLNFGIPQISHPHLCEVPHADVWKAAAGSGVLFSKHQTKYAGYQSTSAGIRMYMSI